MHPFIQDWLWILLLKLWLQSTKNLHKKFQGLPKIPVFHVLFLKKFSHLLINEFFEMVYLVMNRLVRLLDLLISLNFSTRKTFFHKSQKCFLGARKLNMWNTNYHSKRHLADHVRFFFVRLSWIFKRNISKIETKPLFSMKAIEVRRLSNFQKCCFQRILIIYVGPRCKKNMY